MVPSGCGMTLGCPVQPVPHHCFVSFPAVDDAHMAPDSGYCHRTSGCFGTGPSP